MKITNPNPYGLVLVTCETIIITIFGIAIYLVLDNPSYVPVY